jgi:hypothetical protein
MPTTALRRTPILQIRVVGPVDQVHALLAHLDEHTVVTLGADTTRTVNTRTARRVGHLRGYLTITRKEAANGSGTAVPSG